MHCTALHCWHCMVVLLCERRLHGYLFHLSTPPILTHPRYALLCSVSLPFSSLPLESRNHVKSTGPRSMTPPRSPSMFNFIDSNLIDDLLNRRSASSDRSLSGAGIILGAAGAQASYVSKSSIKLLSIKLNIEGLLGGVMDRGPVLFT